MAHAQDLEAVRRMQRAILDHLQARGEDWESFLAWFRSESLRGASGAGATPNPDDEKTVYWFARCLWDVTPLESNGFQPRPLPPPRRGQPCPCGSGAPFESCCEASAPGELPDHVMWETLAQSRPDAFWIEASRQGRLPAIGVFFVATHLLDEARWPAVIDLLEPCFSPERRVDPDLDLTIQFLCDAYDAVDETPRRKEQLLRRLGGDPDAGIRATANRQLASWLHDQGRRDEAWERMEAVERDLPDDAGTALIELTMLAAERRFEEVAARAAERLDGLAGNPEVSPDDLALIRGFRNDPKRGRDDFHRSTMPDEVCALLDWIDAHRQRPRPTLRWRRLKGTGDDKLPRGAHEPLVDARSRGLERRWRRLSGMTNPFSTDAVSGGEGMAWGDADDWLPWLEAHPQALDSLGMLDDLVRLLLWLKLDDATSDDRWTMWLLARSAAMIARSWPARRPGRVPWVHGENRPGLRLLWQYAVRLRENSDARAERFERLYLRLNPADNHGVRQSLVNALLIAGRDADALDLAKRYPDDMHAETAYGRVLALFRLGRLDGATDALASARRHLPLVPAYLLRDLVEAPPQDEFRVRVGGEDQAWAYRDAMRDAWMETDGMKRWLEAQTGDGGS